MDYMAFKKLANAALKSNHRFSALIDGGRAISGDAYIYYFSKPNLINIVDGKGLPTKVNIDSIKEVK